MNRYIVFPAIEEPTAFEVSNASPSRNAEITYLVRVFQILERTYGLDGYTVCFAPSARTRLPRTGPDVIAVIYGEEQCRVPAYAGSVAAVFQSHGFAPVYLPRLSPPRLAQIELVELARNLAAWLPQGWRWIASRETRSRCHVVPVGYGGATDVEPGPFDQRPHVVSFLGSVAPPEAGQRLRTWLGTPKAYCRAALVDVLKTLRSRLGDDAIRLRLTGSFQESLKDQGGSYFDILAKTKICVAPRGTARETWRLCEGLRFGCIVIADRLPPHPFYRDSPILQIGSWDELPALIDELLADPARMRALHAHSLRHWHDVMSEEALAARCAGVLGLRERVAVPA